MRTVQEIGDIQSHGRNSVDTSMHELLDNRM